MRSTCSTWCDQRHFVVVIVFYIVIAINKLNNKTKSLTIVHCLFLLAKLAFIVVKGIDSLCCFVLSRARFHLFMLFLVTSIIN